MPENNFLKTREVARYAGCPFETARYWIKSGKLPSSRPGRHRVVERSELDAFLKQNPKGERRAS